MSGLVVGAMRKWFSMPCFLTLLFVILHVCTIFVTITCLYVQYRISWVPCKVPILAKGFPRLNEIPIPTFQLKCSQIPLSRVGQEAVLCGR